MSIFVIADLHLSFSNPKPMDIFGENWKKHEEKIKKSWIENVNENDLVVLPGDFSWAMYLEETKKDFEYLNSLPGRKLLLKGNHDYWWTSVTKMRKFLIDNDFINIDFLYNNSYEFENYIITGTRGWNLLDEENNSKIINREIIRLKLSLEDGMKKNSEDKEMLVFMHYPPIANGKELSKEEHNFIDLMKKYDVKRCFYGHLHSDSIKRAVEGKIQGINLKLVSADSLDFKLFKI